MMLSKDQMEQAFLERYGEKLYQRFQNATVAVCGLGGLGSNIAISLARAGVGKMTLIDFDKVDVSNLNRQQYKATQIGICKTEALKENLLEIAPFVKIETHNVRLTEANIKKYTNGATVICEAFDDAKEKAMLVNTVLETMPTTYLVAASGMAGLDSGNKIKTKKVLKRFYLCGDEVSDVADGVGLLSTRVMLCAAHQAHTVLRILAKEFDE